MLNLSQLVCAVRHPVQVFVVRRIPYEFSLSRSEGRTWNGGTMIYICSWKGICRAVCPEACCEMRVRHWLNTTLKIPEQKPLCIWLAGTMENFVNYVLSVNFCQSFILTGCRKLHLLVYDMMIDFCKRNGKMLMNGLRAVLEIMFMCSCTRILRRQRQKTLQASRVLHYVCSKWNHAFYDWIPRFCRHFPYHGNHSAQVNSVLLRKYGSY